MIEWYVIGEKELDVMAKVVNHGMSNRNLTYVERNDCVAMRQKLDDILPAFVEFNHKFAFISITDSELQTLHKSFGIFAADHLGDPLFEDTIKSYPRFESITMDKFFALCEKLNRQKED